MSVVGAFEASNFADNGDAYLFDARTGDLLHRLTPAIPVGRIGFGFSVAVDNGVALVGAPYEPSPSGLGSAGSAFLFDTASGLEIAKVRAPSPSILREFGSAVALDEGRAFVGQPRGGTSRTPDTGSVYVFDAMTGGYLRELKPNDAPTNIGFGNAVSAHSGQVLIGANSDPTNGVLSGSAYVFDSETGAQIAKLTPEDGAAGDQFGSAVSIFDGLALVGAWGDNDLGSATGAAYLFDALTGQQLAKFLPEPGDQNFGASVALDADLAVIGSPQRNATYLIHISTGRQLARFTGGDALDPDRFFGNAVAIDGDLAVVGARNSSVGASESGAAYTFRLIPEPAGAALVCSAIAVAAGGCRRRPTAVAAGISGS